MILIKVINKEMFLYIYNKFTRLFKKNKYEKECKNTKENESNCIKNRCNMFYRKKKRYHDHIQGHVLIR